MEYEDDLRAYMTEPVSDAGMYTAVTSLTLHIRKLFLKNPKSNQWSVASDEWTARWQSLAIRILLTHSDIYSLKLQGYIMVVILASTLVPNNVGWRIDHFIVSNRLRNPKSKRLLYIRCTAVTTALSHWYLNSIANHVSSTNDCTMLI